MLHRAGNVDGEGDGCGLLLDLPRKIWAEEVRSGGHDPSLTLDDAFAVAHIFVERSQDRERIQHDARELLGRGGFRILAERIGVVDSPGARPDRARGGAALLAARRPRRRRLAPRPRPLRPADRARAAARRPRPLLLGDDLRLQGDGRAQGPRRVLPRPARRALRDDRLLRPQPLLDQHLALVQARAAVLGARPQRRDQHDRAAAPGGADARRADPARLLGLAGPQPHDRHPGQPRRPQPRRGDGDGRAADRRRDPLAARRAAPLLHVPAPGDGPVRPGPGGADRPPRRRVRVLRRRARPAAALAGRDRRGLRLQLRARRRPGRRDGLRAEAARPGREGAGHDRPRRASARPCTPTTRCCASSASAGCAATAPRRSRPTTAPWRPAARWRARRCPATPTPAPRSRSRSPTASSPASAGSATTSNSSSRWPPTGPSRSARSATTGRWPRSRRSARTSPTTSRRRSPSSPTRRSTANARWSTSRPARSSAAAPRSTPPATTPARSRPPSR